MEYPVRGFVAKDCAVFCKVAEQYGGLSNFAGGYPLNISGISIRTSEALYQCMRFPQRPDVQQKIIEQKSPMAAKMAAREYALATRSDWHDVRVPIMDWTLRMKLIQNFIKFGDLLLSTGNKDIVELSEKDSFWGAKPQHDGTLVGQNVLGISLTELRDIMTGHSEELAQINPITTEMKLLGTNIGTIRLDIQPSSELQF